ncbi:ABC transporter ATP-binding protein [Mesorhizobium sp.]|nr:ABC transporter ATP-binding protein [Mesorhizobium sp.]RWB93848.1 MAG: ABC transporter ATP-binding protein [Mesorhizobium sp.]RWP29793.1 MAG: ABC transporter ATP-binding protein [Mesorhizobium sp.]RWP67930.1 MAG: ABC transporter ATP-binding protein [Mesorhizobium sp.]RWQ18623.1 MAG: ABC transporter ATP-binding protein [Mesorhizobium sp.]
MRSTWQDSRRYLILVGSCPIPFARFRKPDPNWFRILGADAVETATSCRAPPKAAIDGLRKVFRMNGMFATVLRRIIPFKAASTEAVRPNETLAGFVWRASGTHQFYVGLIAVAVALLNFAPIDLQRRIVDEAIASGEINALLFLGAIYLAVVLIQGALKYALLFYQGWVGESAVKAARDQLIIVASDQSPGNEASGQTVNVIGREIDNVGGFVGTSISEFVVNLTLLVVVAAYMLYMQPVIALVSTVFLIPQVLLALYMQEDLNTLVERQVGLVRRLGDETIVQSESNSKTAGIEFRTVGAIFRNRIRFYFLKFGLKTLLNVANAMGPLVALIVGGYLVIQGQTTIGTVVAFVSGFERISGPWRDLLNFYREYEQAKVQHQMIAEWIKGVRAA